METKLPISESEVLQVGDKIELRFGVIGGSEAEYLRAIQLYMLEERLTKKQKGWFVKSYDFTGADEIIFRCEVTGITEDEYGTQEAGAGIMAGVIVAGIIASAAFFWLSLKEIYKITDSPAAQVALVGGGSLAIVVAIILALSLLKKGK